MKVTLMKKIIAMPIRRLYKRFFSFFAWDQWINASWSQEGEDQILRRIFEDQSLGFYVDVGAHHPKRFSNTFLFYGRGWRGINIDAMPGSMKAFGKERPRDINIEVGVGLQQGQLDYYVFNETALNGFSKEISMKRHESDVPCQITETIKINVYPLSAILASNLPPGQTIDFMTVDVEGLDLEVLQSNDWSKYRPKLVLAEVLGSSLHEIDQSEIGKLMNSVGYVIYAKCVNTVFFKTVS